MTSNSPKALAMLSGGLDSILAAKLVRDLGVEVIGLTFFTALSQGIRDQAVRAAADVGIPIETFDFTDDFLRMLRRPKFGYGSGMNPCVDCRITMLRNARSHLERLGAGFVITGEVLGQRPMSQRRDTLRIVERESGLEGLLLRPLSAKLLPPTIPELRGWIDRERLLDLQGRSRKEQIEMAKTWGITEYSQPAGGCFLTDATYARRLRDLFDHLPDRAEFTVEQAMLLKLGRQFRISDTVKVIVGRDERENGLLESYRPGRQALSPVSCMGPLALVEGEPSSDEMQLIAGVVARYSSRKGATEVTVRHEAGDEVQLMIAGPIDENILNAVRI